MNGIAKECVDTGEPVKLVSRQVGVNNLAKPAFASLHRVILLPVGCVFLTCASAREPPVLPGRTQKSCDGVRPAISVVPTSAAASRPSSSFSLTLVTATI